MAQMNAWQVVLGLGALVVLVSALADVLRIGGGSSASATNRARGCSWKSPSSSRASGGSVDDDSR